MTQGPDAKKALLSLLGDHQTQIEELVALLIAKGVISEQEWDDTMVKRYNSGVDSSEWARRCLNPEDGQALDAFFDK